MLDLRRIGKQNLVASLEPKLGTTNMQLNAPAGFEGSGNSWTRGWHLRVCAFAELEPQGTAGQLMQHSHCNCAAWS